MASAASISPFAAARASSPAPATASPATGCGDLIAEREFPSDKVYDRGIVGVESLSAEGLAFVVIHTSVGRAAQSYGSWRGGTANVSYLFPD